MTILSIIICLIIIAFNVKMMWDANYGLPDKICMSVFGVLIGSAEFAAIMIVLGLFSRDSSTKYVYSTKEVPIYALSNSNVIQSTLFACYDKEYVYFNVKDENGYIYTDKVLMKEARFKIDDSIQQPYYLKIHYRYKRYKWGYWFFTGDSNHYCNKYVFVIKQDQISNNVYYDISKY